MWIGVPKSSNTYYTSQKWRGIALTTCALILIATLILFKAKPTSPSDPEALKGTAFFPSSIQFHPSFEFMNGTEVIWQIPNSPKAALFIAPGCTIRASNFWDKSTFCPNCDGLPEERAFVLQALEREFAVLTISSLEECWSFGKELENVEWIIKWWVRENKLEGLPMTALGASSGGYFVSALAFKMRFGSITIMIAEGVFVNIAIGNDYPPTLFVHMPKDRIRMSNILRNMEDFKAKGVDVKEVRCMDFPLIPNVLSDRIPGVNRSFAVKIVEVFHEKGFVDEKGYMKMDGRAIPWKESLKEKNLLSESDEWIKHVEEELNLAYGYHEFCSLKSEDIFEWFDSHMK
uniref:Uncharacterized protein n=1 Tax=Ananas comosus var. bracteatus TaxID=296719 RepID=A0A6V7QGR9_ANACO|nr:unnamed protein product [Ananas comosus var. bracteatus]